MAKVKLKVIGIDNVEFDGECDWANFPAMDGYVGILPNHTRMMTPLTKGKIQIQQGDQEKIIEVENGFLMVDKDETKVLLS